MPNAKKHEAVRTMLPLPFEHRSVAAGRREQIQHGQLLLLPSRCTCGSHPSPLAQDMIYRLSRLAREPGTFAPPNYLGAEGAETLDAQAYEEAVNMLGTYILRLEDSARLFAAHLRDVHGVK